MERRVSRKVSLFLQEADGGRTNDKSSITNAMKRMGGSVSKAIADIHATIF